eukprot:c12154_g1_i1 orf=254-1471(-)
MASVEKPEGKQMQEEGNVRGVVASLQQKHAAMLQRLAINEDARLQKCAALREGSLAAENPNESTDRFLQAFSESFKQLEQTLSSLQVRVSSEEDKSSTKSDLDVAAIRISELEQFVAENSYFLPAYEVRASQSAIASLREKLEGVNAELLPKKRFSFKSKAGRDRKVSEQGTAKGLEHAQVPDCGAGKGIQSVQDLQVKSKDFAKGKASVDAEVEKAKSSQVSDYTNGFATPLACRIRDLEGAVVVKDLRNQEDSEVILENLANCSVYLRGRCRAMYAHKLKACNVYAGPVTGSALIEEVEDCTMMLASHQIRIHHAKKTDMYLRVRSHPIVEYTSDIRVAPYAFSYQGIDDDLLAGSLNEETGLWEHVDDFRWLRAIPSPNWSILPERERAALVDGSAVQSGET